MPSMFEKTQTEFGLLTDTDMLQMVKKGIKDGICHTIYQYATVNYKYTKHYNEKKETSYLI